MTRTATFFEGLRGFQHPGKGISGSAGVVGHGKTDILTEFDTSALDKTIEIDGTTYSLLGAEGIECIIGKGDSEGIKGVPYLTSPQAKEACETKGKELFETEEQALESISILPGETFTQKVEYLFGQLGLVNSQSFFGGRWMNNQSSSLGLGIRKEDGHIYAIRLEDGKAEEFYYNPNCAIPFLVRNKTT